MNFQDALIAEAQTWLDCKPDPGSNTSVCIEKVHNYLSICDNEPWCCAFAWMIVDTVCKKFGITNTLPKTASTVNLVSNAPGAGFVVDTTPARGSIFFYSRGPGIGHVGFVESGSDTGFFAISGNHGNAVGESTYQFSSHSYKFIHTENMAPGIEILGNYPIDMAMVGWVSAGLLLLAMVGNEFKWHKSGKEIEQAAEQLPEKGFAAGKTVISYKL